MLVQIERIAILVLLSLILLWPVGVLAEEIKTIPNKVGKQISSEVLNNATTAIFENLEDLNCKDYPESRGCKFTKQNTALATIGIIIIGVISAGGAIYGIYKRLS